MTQFNLGDLLELPSFTQRILYATNTLQKLGSGSSRTVFAIDDNTVLKVAKNKKGLAQNQAESQYAIQQWSSLVAKVIDSDPNDIFIVMERASKVTPTLFKKILGFSIEHLAEYLEVFKHRYKPSKYYRPSSLSKDWTEMEDNEWVMDLVDLAVNFNFPIPGDLGRLSSYGVVDRGYGQEVVLIDFGLNEEVWETHYARH